MEFVHAARQYVNNYLLNLPSIDNRPIIYIDRSQVERAHIFYSYVDTTMTMLFDASFINYTSQIDRETTSINCLSKTYVNYFCFSILVEENNLIDIQVTKFQYLRESSSLNSSNVSLNNGQLF